MSWGGFGNYSGYASAYANRGGSFPSSSSSPNYSRGGYRGGAGVGSHGYGGGGYGGYGAGGSSYGSGVNSSVSASLGYGAAGYGSSSSTAASLGTGTARIAVIGATQAAFTNWWAMHAAGFQVSVVVGVDDVKGSGSERQATGAQVRGEEEEARRASAETARAFAVRCTEFYHLPRKATAASPPTPTAPPARTTTTSGTTTSPAKQGATDAPPPPAAEPAKKEVVEVRVKISDESADEPAPTGAATTTATTTTSTAAAATARTASAHLTPQPGTADGKGDVNSGPCITATAWSYFLKPFFDATKTNTEDKDGGVDAAPSPTAAGGSSRWSTWSRSQDNTSNSNAAAAAAAATTPLIDEVEVIYVTSIPRSSNDAEAHNGNGDNRDESGVRAALVWLIGKGKHLVVDCALSSDTLAACAAAAATVTRGKPAMQCVLLYRGGGVRVGWSPAAMTQLRTALAVRRGTGQASKTSNVKLEKPALESTAGAAPAKTMTPAVSAAASAKAKPTEADDPFSVFELMDSVGAGAFGGALKEAESHGHNGSRRTSINATAVNTEATRKEESASAAAGTKQAEEKPKCRSASQIATSIALGAEGGVAGALQQLRFTVCGSGISCGGGCEVPCAASLGVMDTFGWDAVAWVLHLLDWTPPDMVQGRVVRRATANSAPLCVEAEFYYGIDGTAEADEETDAEGDKERDGDEGGPRVARPRYLRVLLHIGAGDAVRADTGAAEPGPGVFQQCVRAVGTTAVVTVDHPLLPPPSLASTTLGSATENRSSSPPPSSAGLAASPYKATFTTRVTGVGAAAATAAATTPLLPAVPGIAYSYVTATQDVPPGSHQRVRKEQTVVLPSTEGEPCAEARLWQHVRAQLNVTSSTVTSYASSLAGTGGMGTGGGYQTYGSRYATRGRYGANIGLGGAGGYYGRGRGGSAGYGGGRFGAAAASTSPTVAVKTELTAPEAAALDVQRAWLVQVVVERVLASAESNGAHV
ncbi:hypothetical protein ABB37_02144 [Leptomonas pyrrhocoris]|uniref:Uncharacterized protein n=1 Tax=Leptomonas pyrrhocoris TaxID=157538 RepID=A0A0M9G7A8_LEPPY|nr:hypothetical protein ABB37_02144 [Leptomonas pyrrhocoris]KPA84007.1 hypothetical protein ABB37_02144 [Leptomonas pyrrhocoris]|eukprot:XP_015662446.1 hypothetical protein ABB37_02144 [Leptomonas pyrrhocoris]